MNIRFFLALLLLASPVSAQSFYPNLAGSEYCKLRRFGVSRDEAMKTAMRQNWDSDRPAIWVNTRAGRATTDMIDMATWMVRCDS